LAEILLSIFISSPVEIVFDLSRSIDLHEISTSHTNEKAVAGVTSGLIGNAQTVTWRAKHLFRTRTFTSKITAINPPHYFRDEMQSGDFKKFVHEHFFEKHENGILMKDKLVLEAPYGLIGNLATALFLKNYIRNLVIRRNKVIKSYAESGEWRKILRQT
jgi:ligand-binding SRPBCC domain-containing protein